MGSDRTLKVDVRLVCASNRDLHDLDNGLFRADLYYRTPWSHCRCRHCANGRRYLLADQGDPQTTGDAQLSSRDHVQRRRNARNHELPMAGQCTEPNAVEHCIICAEQGVVTRVKPARHHSLLLRGA